MCTSSTRRVARIDQEFDQLIALRVLAEQMKTPCKDA